MGCPTLSHFPKPLNTTMKLNSVRATEAKPKVCSTCGIAVSVAVVVGDDDVLIA